MKKADITHIEKLLMEADSHNNSEGYDSVYSLLENLATKYSDDFLLYYYKGLVCYSNPDVEEFRTKWAIKHFENSLKLEPNYLMTKIYLAHCHYDLGEYGKALVIFKDILSKKENWDILFKNDQSWRVVNLAEMVAVCNLKLGRLAKFRDYYMPWKDLYYLNIRKDNFYFPESLVVETSVFLKAKGDSMSEENIASFRKISLDLIGIIKGGDGFEEIYAEELKNLKNWDGHQHYQPVRVYAQ